MVRRAFPGLAAAVVVAVVVACGFSHSSGQARESMPRVGILTPGGTETAKPAWDAFRTAMKELGYVEGKNVVFEYRSAEGQLDRLPQLALVQIQDAEAAARDLKAPRSWGAHALLRLGDPLQTALRARTIELAAKTKMPMMYASRDDAVAGGLIGYGVDNLETYKSAAGSADRILKGAKPGELPVQQPTKLELGVNTRTAAALNIKIPQAVLVQADQVIQ